jgi:CRP-like cAMP-binding protein
MVEDKSQDRLELTKNILLRLLRPQALDHLAQYAEIRPIRRGDVIYEDGAAISHAVFPLTGVISLMANMMNGRTIEKGSVGREGFIGVTVLLDGGISSGRAVVQVDGTAAWIPVPILNEAMDRFVCVRIMLLRFGKALIQTLQESVVCNSLHDAEQRVVRWLLQVLDRIDGARFDLKQEAVAEILGLRRATVSTICNRLLDQGILRYSRGHVEVVDRGRLEASACECYWHIRQFTNFRPPDSRDPG